MTNLTSKMNSQQVDTNLTPYNALVIGATGSVGSEIVRILLASENCNRLVTISRKSILEHPKLRNVIWKDFSSSLLQNESVAINDFKGIDVVFCCLGASRSDAMKLLFRPKKYVPKFQLVDKEYVTKTAILAKNAGVHHFSMISAMQASSESRFIFSKIKGETEDILKELNLTNLSVFRPSQLLQRNGPAWEKFLLKIFSVFNLFLPNKYKGIWVDDIAKAMIIEYEQRRINGISGAMVIESDTMQQLAKTE